MPNYFLTSQLAVFQQLKASWTLSSINLFLLSDSAPHIAFSVVLCCCMAQGSFTNYINRIFCELQPEGFQHQPVRAPAAPCPVSKCPYARHLTADVCPPPLPHVLPYNLLSANLQPNLDHFASFCFFLFYQYFGLFVFTEYVFIGPFKVILGGVPTVCSEETLGTIHFAFLDSTKQILRVDFAEEKQSNESDLVLMQMVLWPMECIV